jgi:predicted phosphoribosyltransferase
MQDYSLSTERGKQPRNSSEIKLTVVLDDGAITDFSPLVETKDCQHDTLADHMMTLAVPIAPTVAKPLEREYDAAAVPNSTMPKL